MKKPLLNRENIDPVEFSLDPEDWEKMKQLGEEIVHDMIEHWRTIRDRPAWQPIPEEIKHKYLEPAPQEPQGEFQAYRDFVECVLPYPTGNLHPRFWGWVMGAGTPLGAFAEFLAASLNCNVTGGAQAASHIEQQVIHWLKEMLGYSASASGLLVSGGSLANLVGIMVARNHALGGENVRRGLQAFPKKLRLYASVETHSSILKSVMMLGLGEECIRWVGIDEHYRIRPDELENAIQQDKNEEMHPFCLVGNAGTVNTGAVDDLKTLAEICQREQIWFHVDGAIGAIAVLCDELRPLLAGMEQADSLALDLHKWMQVPYEAGCLLVREQSRHEEAFPGKASYLSTTQGGLSGEPFFFNLLGPQLSRGFRALKIWMSLKEHGFGRFRRLIRQNLRQAQFLVELINSEPDLELMAPVELSIVCFRYRGRRLADDVLDELNERLLVELQEQGLAVPSHTRIQSRFALRVAITNHRTRREDLEFLVEQCLRLGHELSEKKSSID